MMSQSGKNIRGGRGLCVGCVRGCTLDRWRVCCPWKARSGAAGEGRAQQKVAARKYTASFVASKAATISSLQEKSATVACFFDDHEIAAEPCMNTHPDA
eukprot:5643243-Pleurochrysis_carterae.AAC.1